MISVRDLTYTYPGNAESTIRQIGFQVEQGEVFGFLGPSGAGKSTTQKILIRLLQGFKGSIKVMSRKLEDWGDDFYNHVGVGFELPNHYGKLSAAENLRFFSAFYDRPVPPVNELLSMVGV